MVATLKVWNGSAWVQKPMKVWNGSAWVAKPVKFWSGSAWIGPSAAPAFRSIANTTYAARNPTIINVPAGVVDGDIMLTVLFTGLSAAIPADQTPPAGWTIIGTQTYVNISGFHGKFGVWWKRASSEPASYSWSHSGTYSTQGACAAYSGCIASGNPVDVSSQNSANSGTTATATGVTTTQANDMLVYAAHNWDGTGTLNPPSGMTERLDILVYLADQVLTSAGATGNKTQTLASNNPWAAFLVALKGT